MYLTSEAIRRQFDKGTFARGEEVARREKVLHAWSDGDTAQGAVEGSGGQVYLQTIALESGLRGMRIDGRCGCPVQANCKHVVAVLLTCLAQADAGEDDEDDEEDDEDEDHAGAHQPGPDLPPDADFWLRQMADVQASAQAAPGAPDAPAAVPTHLFACVLLTGRDGDAPTLHLCKVRVRKDGSIAGAALQNETQGILARASGADEEAIRLFAALAAGRYGNHVEPSGRLGARFLARLCEGRRLLASATADELKAGRFVMLEPGPARRGTLAWTAHASAHDSVHDAAARAAGNETLALRWQVEEGAAVQVLATEPMLYLHEGRLGELQATGAIAGLPSGPLARLVARTPALRAHQRAAMAARMAAQGLDRILPLPQVLALRHLDGILPVPRLVLDSKAENLRGAWHWHDHAVLSFDYDGILAEERRPRVLRRTRGDAVESIARDDRAEAAADALLAELGFSAPDARSPLALVPEALVLPTPEAWLAFTRHGLARLRAAGWQIDIEGNYRYEVVEAQDWYAELDEEDEGAGGWFSLELGILVDGERHPLLPLLLQMIRRAPQDFGAAALAARADADEFFLQLGGDTWVALPWPRVKPILATLSELYFSERIGRALRLPVTDAARLAELARAAQLRWLGGERLLALGRKLQQFDGLQPVPVPAGLQATLRGYQHTGLAWMQFLREYDFGGILADDMGLGKTVQTLAHILAEKEAGRLDAPALVVAPTSLMANWQAEAARFAPGLRVLLLHGKDRQAGFDAIGGADLVLTTYALLGRDEAALRRWRYHLLILDEAQYIKNSKAKAAQTARLLDARHRLCLTGTPVQNHLGELWSQFHFLMPGLLGEEKTFNTEFRKPIEQQGDTLRADLLARRLRPFMLRRTKDKVATELPPKTEIVLPVDLTGAQRDLYETVRVAMDRKVRDEIDRKGLARSQIVILDALLKLRQVCCDPRLLRPSSTAGSAKLDALMDLLDNLLSEGRKVLVFSQFTSMLALVGEQLEARTVKFALLTGDTVDRAAQVDAFQQGRVGVFLISLKAGGVGLNLTAADTVIHYDPWWNPASENQATDRAWRIGQAQAVFVYKLIARGTLEEKIQDMQRRKGELATALLAPEQGLAAGVGADELQAMFALL